MEQTLGKRIAAYRKELGLTQEGLAEKLGITAQAVSKWENDLSCPDISMLPRLANIFRVTTDELLGIQREEKNREEEKQTLEAEVVAEDSEPEKNAAWELDISGNGRSTAGFGILVLLVGGLLLAGSIWNWSLSFWSVLWPSALLVYGLMGLFRRVTVFRLGCALLGGYELARLTGLIPESFVLGKNIVFPLILVLLGVSILFRVCRRNNSRYFRAFHKNHVAVNRKRSFTKGVNSFSCTECFGENRREICLDKLSYGEATVSFGELKLDLTGCAEIEHNCRLDVACAFGEVELYIPAGCRVEPYVSTVFAQFDIQGAPNPDADVVIQLNGSVVFGEIVVKYL